MKKTILFLSSISLLLSCSTIPTESDQPMDSFFPDSTVPSKTKNSHTPPSAITDALVPNINQSLFSSNQSLKPTRFNISLHEVDAREFFMGLVIDTDENMLVHPDVGGFISLELKNVTIDQVMDAVQKVYGYDYKKNDIGYIVYPATLQTKIFKLNRLDLIRVGQSNTLVSTGQLSNQSNDDENNNNSNSSNSEDNIQIGSWITTETKTDFWFEIDTALRSILSIDPQASVVINRQTGVIIVRAKPMQLREVKDFISITQDQIGRQVIIEAKIIEIILDDSHQAGVNWQSVVQGTAQTLPVLTGVGLVGPALGFSDVISAGGRFGDFGALGAQWGEFGAIIELLETQGKANILSSPKISTLNNQKAIIKVGRDEFFITEVSSDTVTSGSSTIVNPNITFTPFFSGIALDVTPQINDENEITLHIHPSITRVESQTKEFTINGEDGSLPLALNTIRESDSIIKAKNGQVVIIGGLMQETIDRNKRGVVGLSQIPYLGNLFRVNKGDTQKSELVILLKATIVKSNSDWEPFINEDKKQLKQLQNHPLWK